MTVRLRKPEIDLCVLQKARHLTICFKEGAVVMSDLLKAVLWVLVILYLISPADFCPGVIDDVLLLILFLTCVQADDSIGESYDDFDDEE